MGLQIDGSYYYSKKLNKMRSHHTWVMKWSPQDESKNMNKPWHFTSKNGFSNHFSQHPKKHQTLNLQTLDLGFLSKKYVGKMVEKKKLDFESENQEFCVFWRA